MWLICKEGDFYCWACGVTWTAWQLPELLAAGSNPAMPATAMTVSEFKSRQPHSNLASMALGSKPEARHQAGRLKSGFEVRFQGLPKQRGKSKQNGLKVAA